MTLYDRLNEVRDEAYRELLIRLVPNVPPETVVGVRTPEMRRIAKDVFTSADRDAFLNDLPHKYYEENLIHFFVLSIIRDFDECVRKWIASEHVYTARFGIRMLMNEFLDADFKEEYLSLVAAKQGEDYYLRMMVAWYFATALAKRYDETVPYLEARRLDEWTHRKTIQKAIESFRVTDVHKEYLRSLRDRA